MTEVLPEASAMVMLVAETTSPMKKSLISRSASGLIQQTILFHSIYRDTHDVVDNDDKQERSKYRLGGYLRGYQKIQFHHQE